MQISFKIFNRRQICISAAAFVFALDFSISVSEMMNSEGVCHEAYKCHTPDDI